MLEGSWLHGYQVRGPARVENFRDDAGLGRGCFGASAAVMEGRGTSRGSPSTDRQAACPPAFPVGFWRGAPIIDKDRAFSPHFLEGGLQDMHVPEWAPHGTFHSKAALLPPEPRLRPFPVPLLLLPLPASGCCSACKPFLLVLSTRCLFSCISTPFRP